MKRYNRVDRNNWILGILLPILLFFVTLNGTFSYFTASAERRASSTTTAVLAVKILNDQVQVNSVTYSSQLLVPGDTLKYTGTLQNVSSISIYAVVVLTTVITKIDSTTTTLTKYYSRANNAWVEIGITNNAFNASSFEMTKESSINFAFEQLMQGDDYNNDYFGANVVFTVSAYAIQTANLTHAQADVKLYEKVFN